jgi:CRP-like cAMP-binding protein
MDLSLKAKASFFSRATGFQGLSKEVYHELSTMAITRHYDKGEVVYKAGDLCLFFDLVIDGLVSVVLYSALGKRITYLVQGPVTPLNLVGPFTGGTRNNSAEVSKDATLMRIKRQDFSDYAFKNPQLMINIVDLLGQAVDSSNSRFLDMVDKKVTERIGRILLTLADKFGPDINFSAMEISELAGTTTESTLRILGKLREKGIIEKKHRHIRIVKLEALSNRQDEPLLI